MKKDVSIKILIISMILILGSAMGICGQTNGSLISYTRGIGDVNNDHTISIVDALVLAQFYVGIPSADAYLPFGDPSNDGVIDIIDALLVAKYYVGLSSDFTRKSPIDAVKAWAQANHVDLTGYGTYLYGTKETATILPGYSFVVLIKLQYPVMQGNKDPALGTNSIAAVDKNLGVEIINDTAELQQFFRAHEISASSEQKMLLTVKAWLALSQELKDDGFYTFTIRDDSVIVLPTDSIQAEGTTEVTAGGTGAIKANIWFDTPSYLIYNVMEQVELVAGIRPVCQSTKLLDKDPIVRKMAEQDLLAMGTSCRDYLTTQRAKANPELRKAMDRIWQKILDRDAKVQKVRAILGQ